MNPSQGPLSAILPAALAVIGLAATEIARAIEPFTIVVLPDTQHYTDNAQNFPHFAAQARWVASNVETENIVFCSHVGDIVENLGADSLQWIRAHRVLARIDRIPTLPYGVALGNHDYDHSQNPSDSADIYLSYFGSDRYDGRPWYGGASPNQRSHWQRFYAGGRVFLHITLEWQGVSISNNNALEVTTWAQSVLDAHPDTPTIITTHEYLSGPVRSGPGEDIFNSLVKANSQVFMVFGGHSLGESHRVVLNDAGLPVFEILANFQHLAEGGSGYLLRLKFDEDQSVINASTYSPSLFAMKPGGDSQYSFALSFADRFGSGSQALPVWWGEPQVLDVEDDEAELSVAINQSSAELKVVWDTVDRGTEAVADWARVADLPPWIGGNGLLAANLQGLTESTEYCYRFVASGIAPGSDSWSKLGIFITEEQIETAFQSYIASFGLLNEAALPGADPESDLLSNLEEFAFGLNPASSDHSLLTVDESAGTFTPGLPVTGSTGEASQIHVRYLRRMDHIAAGLAYRVQFSTDLLSWQDNNANASVIFQNPASGYEVVELGYPIPPEAGRQFFRLLLTLEAD